MTRGEDFIKKARCKNKHDKSPNPKCNCQKTITFTPHRYMLEGGSNKSKLQKIFRGTQIAWNKFLKPAIIATAPFIGMVVSAKTENSKVGKATTNILKSISGGKILNLTDMHGHGLRLKVMWFHFKKKFIYSNDEYLY